MRIFSASLILLSLTSNASVASAVQSRDGNRRALRKRVKSSKRDTSKMDSKKSSKKSGTSEDTMIRKSYFTATHDLFSDPFSDPFSEILSLSLSLGSYDDPFFSADPVSSIDDPVNVPPEPTMAPVAPPEEDEEGIDAGTTDESTTGATGEPTKAPATASTTSGPTIVFIPASSQAPVATTPAPIIDESSTISPTSAPADFSNGAVPATSGPTLTPSASVTTASPTINATVAPATVSPTTEPTTTPKAASTVPPVLATAAPTTKVSATLAPTSAPTLTPTTQTPTIGPTLAHVTASPTRKTTLAPVPVATPSPTTKTPTSSPSLAPVTASPTNVPTLEQAAVIAPTSSPTSVPITESPTSAPTSMDRTGTVPGEGIPIPLIDLLRGRIERFSYYQGAEFQSQDSYQMDALRQVEKQEGVEWMTDEKVIQYYVLYSIYFAAHGETWKNNDGWDETDLDPCSGWHGIECDDNDKINIINLFANDLIGVFAPEITLLASDGPKSTGAGNLNSLDLFQNQNLANANDNSWFSDLGNNLQYLFLGKTQFGGSLSRLPLGLVEFDASHTLINGGLTAENFAGLDNLTWLLLDGCNFETSIPTEFSLLPKLEYFYISDAAITGDLSYLENMSKIFEHFAHNNPGLGGDLPSFIGDLTTLASLNLGGCGLEGSIPSTLGHLYNMQQLWLNSNSLVGTIPNELGRLIAMETFEIEGNNLSGTVPELLCELKQFFSLEKFGADCSALECECCDCCSSDLCREFGDEF